MDLEQKRREDARWKILLIAEAGYPIGVNENLIIAVLRDDAVSLAGKSLRRELDYLAANGLLTVAKDQPDWAVRITPAGVDVVQYVAGTPAGIARPPQKG